jgi:predicted RNA-binding Zn ribbon-like protein
VDSWFVRPPQERLGCFEDWLAWSRTAGTLEARETRAIGAAARRAGGAAARALRRIRALRDSLARVFQAAAHGRAPAALDLELIDRRLAEIRASRHIVWEGKQYREAWPAASASDLEAGLRPILLSAEALLLDTAALARLHECPAERCGWLFLDVSRNGSRRWCSMRTCGNLAKAHRHQARRRRARRSNPRGNAV